MSRLILSISRSAASLRKQFLWYTFKKKFLWITENFVNSNKFTLIQRNRFVYINEKNFDSTKLSSNSKKFFLWLDIKEMFLWFKETVFWMITWSNTFSQVKNFQNRSLHFVYIQSESNFFNVERSELNFLWM